MTAPKEVKGFKSKNGMIWDTMDDAIRSDICQMIMEYADANFPSEPDKMFRTHDIIEDAIKHKGMPSDVAQLMGGKMVQSEVEVIAHWIFNNMELLESLIAYYIQAKTELSEVEK